MVIEVRKNHATINGKRVKKEEVLGIFEYVGKDAGKKDYRVDLRRGISKYAKIKQAPMVEIRNRSGHHLIVLDTTENAVGLRSTQAIKLYKGQIKSMGPYTLR